MPYGAQRRALEIATTTLALDPEDDALWDEPMAGMGHEDIDKIAALIKRIFGKSYTILMVEHNSVRGGEPLRHHHRADAAGQVLAEGNYADLSKDRARQGRPIWGAGHA